MTHDLLIRNGRVVDPETRFDEVCDVAIADGLIAAVGTDLGPARREIDATGRIVCPGFIDLHAHGQSVAADRMQAFDGVTTTLELEVGALPVAQWYEVQAGKRRVLNYGTAAAWILARKVAFGGFQARGGVNPVEQMGERLDDNGWSADAADEEQTERLLALTRQGLEQGAIGIGIPNAYAPGAGARELTRICDLAKEFDCPTYTHIAYASNIDPNSSVESYVRLIGLAGATGAHMHICHMNSTSLRDIERCVEVVMKAQAMGLPVTTEAYPYGTGATVVSATFFADPEFTRRTGSDYNAIELIKNRHRFVDRDDVMRAARENPSDLVMWHFLGTEVDDDYRRLLDMSVTYPGGSIASDAMPWITPDGRLYEGAEWPLPDELSSHPRSAGTFTRFLREYAREREAVPLVEALAKCTIHPARVIDYCTPQMARKGRLREGFDADVLVFDYDRLTDRASFEAMNGPSEGVEHLLVGGQAVIADGRLDPDASPGKPIRRPQR
ncbi:D-glutamate deacylase [Thalassobaculum fulvum]|uniref:D-glutamate deacylase n=1 Tax=Thalassobaculum fulvum TaxID=1633335 RepID=A0A919CSI6_9PROT|nr:amidohydrolase family protein [Thalassobaculum fulvum]GHD62655.1 D-glutamate deacylase [Thalassobaculum fulvum]